MKEPKPILRYTDQAKRDLENIRLFLWRTLSAQPSCRIREITQAADRLRDSPRLYPVNDVHPISRLAFRRKNVGQFVIIYAYIEPTGRRPEGMVNIRAIRHDAKEDVLFRVEELRAIVGWEFPLLRTGHHTRDACWRGEPVDGGNGADAIPYRARSCAGERRFRGNAVTLCCRGSATSAGRSDSL